MRTCDQIIFDELAARRSVMLEEVGYLKIDSIPAKVTGNKTVSAPRNVVAYTPDMHAEARNVINILESEGIDYQQAREQYYGWLAEARKDNVITIQGAGVLKDDIFTPTPELEKILNPGSQAVVVKRKNTAWLWIVIIAALLVLIFFGYRSCNEDKKKKQAQTENVEKPAEPVMAPDTVSTNVQPEQQPADGQTDGNGLNYPLDGRYYVVAGVFDFPENADKLIEQLKRKFPDLTMEKFDYPGIRPGRTMVTVYSSTNPTETLNMRRQLAWSYDLHEYLIYPPLY